MYINFHAHSVYSTQDAISEPLEIAQVNKQFGNTKFCITDHGNLSSFVQAYVAAEQEKMQFIPGCEFYVIPEAEYWSWSDKHNDDVEVAEYTAKYHHLVAIAKNQKGVESLIKIYNTQEPHYGKPCVSRESIFKNKEGLIILSACVAGELIFYLEHNNITKAKEIMQLYKDEFGDDYYCELQYHNLSFIDEQLIYSQLIKLARELNIKMVPTTDSHFNYKEDVVAHNIYKDIFYKSRTDVYDWSKHEFKSAFNGEGYYIKNEQEIKNTIKQLNELTTDEIDAAIKNTEEISNKCEETEFPKALPLVDKEKELRALVAAGFKQKRVGTKYENESRERIKFELETICNMGFTEYFINVNAIVTRARMLNLLPGCARGCFLPGMLVSTLDKGDSYVFKPIELLHMGSRVLTHDLSNQVVTKVHKYKVENENCISVKLSNGLTVKCTADHKFYSASHGFIEAQELKVGDVVEGNQKASRNPVYNNAEREPIKDISAKGNFNSNKNNKTFEYNSLLELKLLNNLEIDTSVKSFETIQDAGIKQLKYSTLTPYLVINYKHDKAKIVITASDNDNYKCDKLDYVNNRYWYESLGYEFCVLNEHDLNMYGDKHSVIVAEIESFSYSGYVYDLQVSGTHNYNINGAFVHNSAAGSEVCYLLGITGIDPIKNGLIFERFLNPSRWNYPDIDLDIQSASNRKGMTGKDIVLESLSHDKFPFSGPIVNEVRATTLTLFKQLSRAFKLSPQEVNKLTTDSQVADEYFKEDKYTGWLKEQLRNKNISCTPIWEEFEKYIPFCYRYGGHDTGDNAHGLLWNRSVHASGVILYPYKNKNILPKNEQGVIYKGHDLEKMGYIKYDMLSLDALNPINYFIPKIEKDTGKPFDWEDNDDPATWEVFKKADTDFVFQFSSPGMKTALSTIKPESIDVLAELNSLYRPGCIGAGIFDRYLQDSWTEEEKVVGQFLKEEFGEQHSYAMIFQEDIMKVVEKMAGFSLADADLVRRAMARKEADTLNSYKEQFVTNFDKEKYGDIAETVWKTIEAFSTYTFNKSHSVAYSCIAYWTAYLFAHYKDEYMEYLINNSKRQKNEAISYLSSQGYTVVYPTLKTRNTQHIVKDRQIFIPTTSVQDVDHAGEYLLNLNAERNKMIVKFGIFDNQCVDRRGLRDLFKALDKNKLKKISDTERRHLYAIDDIKELINNLSALNLINYTVDNDLYKIEIIKARSTKEMELNFLINKELLQFNAQEDIRAYGIARDLYCDALEEVDLTNITKFYNAKVEGAQNKGLEWDYYTKNRILQDLVFDELKTSLRDIVAPHRCICKKAKLYETWGKATLVFTNNVIDVTINKNYLPFFKRLSNNTPITVEFKFRAYLGKDNEIKYTLVIQKAELRSF